MTPLPCPFCGQAPHVESYPNYARRDWRVICRSPECATSPSAAGLPNRFSAVEAWNRRASPSGTLRESPASVTRCPLSKSEREFIASAVVKAIAEIEATSPDHAAGIALRTFRDTVLPRYEATIAALESVRESPADSGTEPATTVTFPKDITHNVGGVMSPVEVAAALGYRHLRCLPRQLHDLQFIATIKATLNYSQP